MQFPATRLKSQPQRFCWERSLMCADASQVSELCERCQGNRSWGGSREAGSDLLKGNKPHQTPRLYYFCSRVECSALMFPNSIPDLAECSKSSAWQSTSRGISQAAAHNQYSRFQYLEISSPQSFCPFLRVKKLFCNEVIKIWQETTEKLWNILNLGSGFGELKRNL